MSHANDMLKFIHRRWSIRNWWRFLLFAYRCHSSQILVVSCIKFDKQAIHFTISGGEKRNLPNYQLIRQNNQTKKYCHNSAHIIDSTVPIQHLWFTSNEHERFSFHAIFFFSRVWSIDKQKEEEKQPRHGLKTSSGYNVVFRRHLQFQEGRQDQWPL